MQYAQAIISKLVFYINPSSLTFCKCGTSLVAHWLRLYTSNTGCVGLIPGWDTKISHAVWHGQRNEKKKKITFFYKNYQLKKNYLKVYPKILSTLLIVAVLLLYKYF